MTVGIYQILNTATGKSYVGSSVCIARRFSKHKALLRSGKHVNAKLQASWNKHGESVFVFSALEYCDEGMLDAREQAWMQKLNAVKQGYNINPVAGSNRGYKHTEESKLLISKAVSGREVSEATRNKRAALMTGTSVPQEVRERISLRLKEISKSADFPGRRNLDRTGTKQTPEQIAKRVAATARTKSIKAEQKLGATER
jgi:group I intron endonuclease